MSTAVVGSIRGGAAPALGAATFRHTREKVVEITMEFPPKEDEILLGTAKPEPVEFDM
jgi:hypothetical protein